MAQNETWLGKDDAQAGSAPSAEGRSNQGMFAWYAQGFSDPLGDRLLLFDNTSGAPLELLRLRPELSQAPGFETAVRERANALAGFEDVRHARVCRVDRLPDPGGGLAIVSDGTQGQRLSEILHVAEQQHLQPGGDIVRRLVAELVTALASFHRAGAGMVHGALAPHRLVVSPTGQLLVTEYVLGAALARVPLDRAVFWGRLRLALPADRAVPPFDQRTDVVQAGTIALALVLGRMLREDEYPARLPDLIAEAHDRLVLAGWGPLSEPFRDWLTGMLHLDGARAFADGPEASAALTDAIGTAAAAVGSSVEGFMRACAVKAPAPAMPGTGATDQAPALPAARDDEGHRGEDPFALVIEKEPVTPARAPVTVEPSALPPRPPAALPPASMDTPRPRRWRQIAILVLLLVAIAEGVFIGARWLASRGAKAAVTGTVSVDSNPPQATVLADGKRVGATPVRLELAPGRHVIEVAAGERRRTITVTSVAGTLVSHYVDLPQEQPQTGNLRVVTAPPGGRVFVDGQPRGASPLLVTDLAPGKHEVVVEGRQGSVRQTVDVEQNSTAALFVPLPGAAAPSPGWLSISAPVELNVFEDSEMVGTSRSARIMLPAGRHSLQLVADIIGFKATRDVDVPVGKTVTLDVSVPNGRMDINALPWAEVLIDGRRVGETPLSGVMVPAGRHVITFRHPQLGERSVDSLVTLQAPARVSVDLRK